MPLAGGEHHRPARGAGRRRLRDRRDQRRRLRRLGERPGDPRQVRHRHARRRLGRAGRDHAGDAQHPGAGRGRRNVAEVAPDAYVFNYTNPAPTEAMAMRRAAPGVKTFALCSCTGHPGSAEWLAGEAGVAADQIAMPPVVGGHQPLRVRAGVAAGGRQRRDAAGARERDQPGGAVGAGHLRRAALLLEPLGRALPADAAAGGGVRGHRAGREDEVRHHDARHGLREGAGGRVGGAGGDVDGARRRAR